MTCIVINLSSS